MKMHSNHVLAGRYGEIFLVEEVDSMPPRLYVLKRMVIHPMNLKAIKSEIAMMVCFTSKLS